MGDVGRITTTERRAELREAVASVIATADGYNPSPDPALWELDRDHYLALADVAIERVVEGLVATIKAMEHQTTNLPHSHGSLRLGALDAVLAVVEAAREDTT